MKSLEQIFCLRPEYVTVLATKSSQTCRHKVQCVRKFLSRSGPLVNHHKLLCSQPGAEVRMWTIFFFFFFFGGGVTATKKSTCTTHNSPHNTNVHVSHMHVCWPLRLSVLPQATRILTIISWHYTCCGRQQASTVFTIVYFKIPGPSFTKWHKRNFKAPFLKRGGTF